MPRAPEIQFPDAPSPALLESLKARIAAARRRAAVSVNSELVLLYWDIGRRILARQSGEGWGAKVIDRLGADLRRAFPEMKGLSPRNLKYMRAFAAAYPARSFVQQPVAQLTWSGNLILLDKVEDPAEREWYARQAVAHGWGRNVLAHQIDAGLFARQGKALTNFRRTLPPPQSDLARQLVKDPYQFDFLGIGDEAKEREVERALIDHLRDFLLELGKGFAFVGSQVRLEVSGQDFHVDLLFYHLWLHCYVVIELKAGDFKPEYAGKMSFYLSAVDDLVRRKGDKPSLGIILCRSRDRLIVEYALRDSRKPIGVSSYELTKALPDELKGTLPTVGELEDEMGRPGSG